MSIIPNLANYFIEVITLVNESASRFYDAVAVLNASGIESAAFYNVCDDSVSYLMAYTDQIADLSDTYQFLYVATAYYLIAAYGYNLSCAQMLSLGDTSYVDEAESSLYEILALEDELSQCRQEFLADLGLNDEEIRRHLAVYHYYLQ